MVSAMARRAFVAALVLIASVLIVSPARAVVVCTFDDPTATVTITLDNGDVARVVRSGDAITVDGTPCDLATVTNTDTIDVSSTGTAAEVVIDLSGGPFAPGETAETDAADSEIEWLVDLLAGSTLRIVGSDQPDDVVVGADGINLNADEATGDVDVVISGAPSIVIEGKDGNDVLSNAGGAGTGGEGPVATLQGDAADDDLVPGSVGTTVDGGDGQDTVDYGGAGGGVDVDLAAGTAERNAGTDTLIAIENAIGGGGADTLAGDSAANALDGGAGDDKVSGGPGDDALVGGTGSDLVDASGANAVIVNLGEHLMTGQGTDSVNGFENVRGSDGNDKLTGDGQGNTLDGGAGADRLDGRSGGDDLKGGKGDDTVTYGSSSRRMTINLGEGTATGAGSDTLTGIENVEGSPKDDVIDGSATANVLDGRSGIDEVNGRDGKDRVVGDNGADILFGGIGNDVLLGGTGRDQLDGGQGNDDVCRGGEDADAFVGCENYDTTGSNVWIYETA